MLNLPIGISSVAPEYETQQPGPTISSIVSIFNSEGEGVRLKTNPSGYGYRLARGATGLSVAPVANTSAPLSAGGAVLRHQRLTETKIVLPIQVHARSGRELRRMISKLTDILSPGEGAAVLSVYSPYSNEARYMRVMYEGGLEDPEWDAPNSEKYTLVLDRVDPYWFGELRVSDHEVQPSIKPYITKDWGEPDPEKSAITPDGDTPDVPARKNAYEFPFFPIYLSDSTIQGELDLQVEGDSPTHPTYIIRGPGKDPQFLYDGGRELFIPGRIDSEITIVTTPQEENIYDDSGPLWHRVPVDRAAMVPLRPGQNKISFSMVESSTESQVRIQYRELWRSAY